MHRLVASVLGVGLIPGRIRGSDGGAGTLASLLALPFALLIGDAWGWGAQLAGAIVLTGLSLWSSGALASTEGDAGWIVIDEAAGTFLSVVGLLGWPAIAAFVVFRVADIVKRPFPGVYQADQVGGAVGITADDLVAGLYGLAVGHLIRLLVS